MDGTRRKYRERKDVMDRQAEREREAVRPHQGADGRPGRYGSSPAVVSLEALSAPGPRWTRRMNFRSSVVGFKCLLLLSPLQSVAPGHDPRCIKM